MPTTLKKTTLPDGYIEAAVEGATNDLPTVTKLFISRLPPPVPTTAVSKFY
jgi:hypothetical protein